MLLLSRGGVPECVVPANLKLEKAEGVTPSELADKTDLQGQVVAKSVGSAGRDFPARSWGEDRAGRHPGHGIGGVPARPEFSAALPAGSLTWANIPLVPMPARRRLPWRFSTSGMDKRPWRPTRPPQVWPAKLREIAGGEVSLDSGQWQVRPGTREPTLWLRN